MTARPEWLRKGQTARQIDRRGFPFEEVAHTGKYGAKVEHLLLRSVGMTPENGLDADPEDLRARLDGNHVGRIVLIDDSAGKVISGAKKLAEARPNLRPLQERFTLFAFGQEEHYPSGRIIPGVAHVINMQGWSDIRTAVATMRASRV